MPENQNRRRRGAMGAPSRAARGVRARRGAARRRAAAADRRPVRAPSPAQMARTF